jgi:hypothetical protein
MLSIEQIYKELGGKDGAREGITYGLTEGNSLDELLTTPNLWGHDPSITDYIPAAQNLTQAITKLLASATRSIDISVLYRFPDGLFLDALRDGIKAAYKNGYKPLIRILCGCYYPSQANEDIEKFILALGTPRDIEVYVAHDADLDNGVESFKVDYCRR